MRIVIDTDPGLGEPGSDIDDGLAIALALRSPELTVEALTIVNGNVDLPTGIDVARRLTARLGYPDLPVLAGAATPLTRDMEPVRALFDRVLGARNAPPPDRLGPTSAQPAAEYLVELAAASPGDITVVAIGPLTNVAAALRLDSAFAGNVAEIVMMAGSATGYAQNVTPVGDFNAYVDPEALAEVLASGAKLTMVGIDQTSQVTLSRADAITLRSGDEFADWVADCTEAWIDFLAKAFPTRPEHQDACFLHDPLVIAAVIDRRLCGWAQAHVSTVIDSELARGLVIADRGLALAPTPGAPNATVAISTDVAGFRRLVLPRLASSPERPVTSG
jgi:inosine-uridine nucleoside N-ribohydrolase